MNHINKRYILTMKNNNHKYIPVVMFQFICIYKVKRLSSQISELTDGNK